jgi:hypothetical protein
MRAVLAQFRCADFEDAGRLPAAFAFLGNRVDGA